MAIESSGGAYVYLSGDMGVWSVGSLEGVWCGDVVCGVWGM